MLAEKMELIAWPSRCVLEEDDEVAGHEWPWFRSLELLRQFTDC